MSSITPAASAYVNCRRPRDASFPLILRPLVSLQYDMTAPSLQHARPRLKSGQVFGSLMSRDLDGSILFELADGSRQVSLPTEATEILPLLDGAHTIPAILEQLHRTHGRVPFKKFFGMLQRLQTQGCLEGAEMLVTPAARSRVEMFERAPLWLTRPIASRTLAAGKILGEPSALAFGLFALATLVVTISFLIGSLSLGLVQVPSGFLRIQESYVKGIFFFFIAASVLITAKTVIKTILSLLLTGVRSTLTLELGLFSLAVRSHDDKIYLAGGRTLGALAFAAVASSYFFIFAVASAVAPHWARLDDLFWVSAILALVDLNPFRKSDLSSFFQIVFNRSASSALLPYLQNRGLLGIKAEDGKNVALASKVYTAYSTLAIAWTMLAYNLLLSLITRNDAIFLNSLTSALNRGDRVEALAALLVGGGLLVSLLYLLIDLGRTLTKNILHPLRSRRLAEKAEAQSKPAVLENVEDFARTLSQIPLFAGLHTDALLFLISKGQTRAIRKGSPIVAQDSLSTELFILVEGEVLVRKRHASGAIEEVTRLQAPTVFGENTVLANAVRSADVMAQTNVRVIAIPRTAIEQLLHHSVLKTEAEPLLDRLILGQYVAASELFREAPSEVVSLFFNEGEIVDVATGRHIIEQGRTDKDFYLLIRGSVDVIQDGQIIARIDQGGFFGEMALIMNAPRTATIMTREPCRLLKISSRQFWNVLSQHASVSLYLESVSESREVEYAG